MAEVVCGNSAAVKAKLDLPCERCAYLERELGLQIARTEVDDVVRGLGVSVSQARLLIALYRAKGRVLSLLDLEEAAPSRTGSDERGDIVRVHVHHIRKRLVADAILSCGGLGYRLGEPGRAPLSPILETTS